MASPPLEKRADILPCGHQQNHSEEAHGQETCESEIDLGVTDLNLRDLLAGQRTLCVFFYHKSMRFLAVWVS